MPKKRAEEKIEEEPKPEIAKTIQNKAESESLYKGRKKQLYFILASMLFLFIVFFLSYYFFSNLNKFEYKGITFTKTKYGELPVFHHYYYFNSAGKLYQYNLYLRNDPRKNNVLITGRSASELDFPQGNPIYISVNPKGLTNCSYAMAGIGTLSTFLTDNQLKVKGASPIEQLALETNVTYADCNTHRTDNVIIIQAGNETKIIREKSTCTIIQISNCEVLQAIEKFELQALMDARARKLTSQQQGNQNNLQTIATDFINSPILSVAIFDRRQESKILERTKNLIAKILGD